MKLEPWTGLYVNENSFKTTNDNGHISNFVFLTFQTMISPFLFIAAAGEKGRGVFTSEDIDSGTLIEIAPVIVMGASERRLLDQTRLHDYIFEWGDKKDRCCMALGYVPVYNHAYNSNCEYEMDFASEQILIRTVKQVKAGEELYINYNGDWNDGKKLWFDAK